MAALSTILASYSRGQAVQAFGGAKNHLIVMPDADRCLAGSVLVAVGDVADPLLDLLVTKTKTIKLDESTDPQLGMVPLVTADHHKKVAGYIESGVSEAAVPVCDGREAKSHNGGYFLGPTIFDRVTPDMTIAREEDFGPVLSMKRVNTLEDAIELVNSCPYSNTISIFTNNGKAAREYTQKIEAGMVCAVACLRETESPRGSLTKV